MTDTKKPSENERLCRQDIDNEGRDAATAGHADQPSRQIDDGLVPVIDRTGKGGRAFIFGVS